MSQQGRISWVSLIVTVLISVWYFAVVLGMPGDTHLFGLGMGVFAFILNGCCSRSPSPTCAST
jgi:hypothetical protein